MLRATILVFSLVTALTLPAMANGMTAEQIVEVAVISVDETGAESVRYEAASEIAPGDEVRYRLDYANDGTEAAENVSLVMPVPTEITLIEGSVVAGPALVTYSADAGVSFASRDALEVIEGDETRPATASDITHVRWVFATPIAAGEAGSISFSGVLQ